MRRRTKLSRSRIARNVYYFTRTAFFNANIQSSTTAAGSETPGTASAVFRLSDLPNSTEFTALFDQYKIMKVNARWMPRGNVSESAQQAGIVQNTITDLFGAVDLDDISAPASRDTLLQYANMKHVRSNRALSFNFVPAQLVETYNNGVTTGYTINRRPHWIDCANPSVQHFGIKLWLDAPHSASGTFSANTLVTYDLMVTYTLAFRGVI